MTLLYVGVGLVVLALLTAVLLLVSTSSGPTGVAKSLLLIDEVGGRAGRRSRWSWTPGDRLLSPILDRTRGSPWPSRRRRR